MQCNATYKKSGILMDDFIYLKNLNRKDQEKLIYEKYPSLNLKIMEFNIFETNDVFPKLIFNIKMYETSFLSKSGSYYTFKPNYLNILNNSLKQGEKRENDIYFQNSFIISDTILFNLPENFVPEYLPNNNTFESLFGKFHYEYRYKNNVLTYIRTYIRFSGTFAKEKYSELYSFLTNIQLADNLSVIFKSE
jgi:hypothetical protein